MCQQFVFGCPQPCVKNRINAKVPFNWVCTFVKNQYLCGSISRVFLLFLDICVYKLINTTVFIGGTVIKNPLANAGATKDLGSILGLGRSPGVGNGNRL